MLFAGTELLAVESYELRASLLIKRVGKKRRSTLWKHHSGRGELMARAQREFAPKNLEPMTAGLNILATKTRRWLLEIASAW